MKLRKLENSDLPQMEEWLHNSHIEAFLGDAAEWLTEMKENRGSGWIEYFIAEIVGPVGFIQYYDTSRAPVGIWSQAPQFSLGIDFFIGESQDQAKATPPGWSGR
ncbi:MAG: acetyltransferase [Rikenellaceae bacterium]|nr:acetyltransferase [Rikenellaceae bacterium]